MKTKPPGERFATPDDFTQYHQEFMGEFPSRNWQMDYINKNDWPILVVLASSLGAVHAVAKRALRKQQPGWDRGQLNAMESVIEDIARRKINDRLDKWHLDIPDIEGLLKRVKVTVQAVEFGVDHKLNITLPAEFRMIFERYRTLGYAMIQDHMNQHTKELEQEEATKKAAQQVAKVNFPPHYASGTVAIMPLPSVNINLGHTMFDHDAITKAFEK